MGIEVPEYEMSNIGITLPMAYMAIAQNTLTLRPVGPWAYVVSTRYSIWTSYESRQNGKDPMDVRFFEFDTPADTTSLESVYGLAYDRLKQMYPNYIDHQDPAQHDPNDP